MPIQNFPSPMLLDPAIARTTTTNSATITDTAYAGATIFWNIISVGTGNLTLYLQFQDPNSPNSWSNVWNSGTTTTSGLRLYQFYPSGAFTGTTISGGASIALATTWRMNVVHSDGSSWTYGIGYSPAFNA